MDNAEFDNLLTKGYENINARENQRRKDERVAKNKNKEKEAKQLKLWHIMMYTQRKFSELVTDTFLVLASSEQKATDYAFAKLGYLRIDQRKDHNYHIWEVKGPFKEGTIVWRDPTAGKK